MARYGPLWQQEQSYSASLDRLVISSVWPNGGVLSGATLSPNATTMHVGVSAGACVVPINFPAPPPPQGAELCVWDVVQTLTLAAAPTTAGQSRNDLIVCQVQDDALDSGGVNTFVLQPVTGTPATTGSQTTPATPNNALALGFVTVPANVTNLSTATATYLAPSAVLQAAYLDVAASAPSPFGPTITPPEGLLWLDTSTTPSTLLTPPPVTTGSTIQTFTDTNGELWIAKNGVNGGNWKRPRDVLHARVFRNAAWTTSSAQTIVPFDTVSFDAYGMWNAGSYYFVAPVPGYYLLTLNVVATNTATNQFIQNWVCQNGAAGAFGTSRAYSWSATAAALTAPLSALALAAASDQFSAYNTTTTAWAGSTNVNNTFLSISYLGSG